MHKHAELMKQYAEDAMSTDEPWKLWEVNCGRNKWDDLQCRPHWRDEHEYRRKPQTIEFQGIERPKPLNTMPSKGDWYFSMTPVVGGIHFGKHEWRDVSEDRLRYYSGLCFATEEQRDEFWEVIQ